MLESQLFLSGSLPLGTRMSVHELDPRPRITFNNDQISPINAVFRQGFQLSSAKLSLTAEQNQKLREIDGIKAEVEAFEARVDEAIDTGEVRETINFYIWGIESGQRDKDRLHDEADKLGDVNLREISFTVFYCFDLSPLGEGLYGSFMIFTFD